MLISLPGSCFPVQCSIVDKINWFVDKINHTLLTMNQFNYLKGKEPFTDGQPSWKRFCCVIWETSPSRKSDFHIKQVDGNDSKESVQ